MPAPSEADRDIMIKLWREGWSATQIAKRFPGRTRNSIIGLIHRAGETRGTPSGVQKARLIQLQGPTVTKPRQYTKPSPRPAVRHQAKVFGPTKVKPALAIAGNGAVFEKPEGHEPKLAPTSERAWLPLVGSEPVPMLQLSGCRCKWPVTVPETTEHMFCGLVTDGGAYCAPHRDAEAARSATQHPKAKASAKSLARMVERLAA